ncbi:hypothetical protein STEG23_004108, partial [Scotinomys teguina]
GEKCYCLKGYVCYLMAFPRHVPLEPLSGDIFGRKDFADMMKLWILEVAQPDK